MTAIGKQMKNKTKKTLNNEAIQATEILQGKVVRKVWRHRAKEVGIEFTDGTRLFVDHQPDCVELSITPSAIDQ